jgi:hypothetical protein
VQDGRITITWLPQPKMFEYLVEYREQGKDNAEWFNVKTTSSEVTIYDAVPGRKYDYRVGGYCTLGNKTLGDVHGFTVPSRDTTANRNCGLLPDIKLANQTALQELKPDDQIMAGDFPVRLLQVRGAGSFTGYGYITIPFLGYNRLKVKFDNIKVNTDRQLMSGVIMSTFDSLGTQIVDVDKVVQAVKDFASVINDLAHLAIDEDYLAIKELTEQIKEMAEAELPEELKNRMNTAADNMEQSKKEYDEAKKEYDAAQTPEEKAAAKKKMDTAEKKFEDAKKEVAAVNKEKEKLVKDVADVLVKAIKALKADADKSSGSTSSDFATQQRLIKEAVFDKQGITGDTTANTQIEALGGFDETLTESDIPASSKEFAALVKDYSQKRKLLITMKLIFAASDFYKDEAAVNSDFKDDVALDGKTLIKEIMSMQMKDASKADMIKYATEQLKLKIDNLLK